MPLTIELGANLKTSSIVLFWSVSLTLSACGQSQPEEAANGNRVGGDLLVDLDHPDPSSLATARKPTKVYTEADIEWEYAEDAIPYKVKVVAGINKILRENARCADVQTTSLYRAEGFSKAKPIFYIQCDAREGLPFGVTFNVNDVDTGKKFGAATIIEENVAWAACRNAASREADGLQSLWFPPFSKGNFIPHNDGRSTVAVPFTAKNALGVDGRYKAICWFSGQQMTDHTIKPE